MLIFYVDESGSHAGDSPWFVLAGAGIRDTTRRPLAEAVAALKRKHFAQSADHWEQSEIKGRQLAIARQRVAVSSSSDPRSVDEPLGYQGLDTLAKVDALEKDLAILFARFRPIVFTVAIDKRAMVSDDSMATLGSAYAFLFRRIALSLERIYQGEGAVLVADQQSAHEKYFNSGEMTAFRTEIDAKGGRRADYDLILDKPLWLDSKLSSWDREIIQLADLAAFEMHQICRGLRPTSALWPQIYRCLGVDLHTGAPEREGIVIFPHPKTAAWPHTQQ